VPGSVHWQVLEGKNQESRKAGKSLELEDYGRLPADAERMIRGFLKSP
jgi:hypothetical protein